MKTDQVKGKMITDIHHLDSVLDSLEAQLGLNIVVHDNHAFFYDTEGRPLISRHRSHGNAYCGEKRASIVAWDRRCMEECQVNCQIRSEKEMVPWIKDCWKGAREISIPLICQGVVQGVMHVGLFRSPINGPPKGLESSYEALPELVDSSTNTLIEAMGIIAKGLIHTTLEVRDLGQDYAHKRRLEDFLHVRSHERLSIDDVASLFSLSASRSAHVVKEEFGLPFVQLLHRTRVNKAKLLLINSSWSIAKIADQVGFESEFYFSRIFKKVEGLPPGQFRSKNT
jgi:AraC-like DNA-binding protein